MLVWPIALMPSTAPLWRLDHVSAGNISLDGSSTYAVTSGGGAWRCEMPGITLMGATAIKAARALAVMMDGGATLIEVPSCECAFAPVPSDAVAAADSSVPFSDDATFSDGSMFMTGGIDVGLSADADLRATTIEVDLTTVGPLTGGEAFEINHAGVGKRRYEIGQVDGTTLTIRPPLREDTPAGTALNFDRPACVMRLVNSAELISMVHAGRLADMTAVFEEAFA